MSDKKSAINSGTGENTAAPNPMARKPRRWPWMVAVLVLLVLLGILAIPSLLCTGPGVRLIESQVNSRISGSVRIGRMSLGWFTPLELDRVTLKDPNGDVVLGDVSVVTHRSILNLISNWQNLGQVAIDIKTLKLRRDSNNQINIMQALANPHPAAAPAATRQAAAAPAGNVPGGSSKLPGINTTVTLTMEDASFTAPGLREFHALHTRLCVGINTLANKPLELQLDTAAGLGNQRTSKIHVAVTAHAISDGEILPADQITGQVTAGIEQLNLAALSPVLSVAGIKLSPSGVMTLALTAKIPSPGTGSVDGNMVVDHAALSGSLLKGDSPQLGTVRVPIGASWRADEYQIQSLGVQTALGSASVTGHGSIATVLAVLHHQNTAARPAVFQVTAAAPLARLLAALPHILTPKIDPILTGGKTRLSANVTLGNPGGTTVINKTAELPPLTGMLKFDLQPLHWSQAATGSSGTTQATGIIRINTLGRPLKANIHLHIARGSAKPANFSLAADFIAVKNGRILPLNQITGGMNLLITHLHLTALSALISPTGQSIAFHGELNGRIKVTAPKPGRGVISGPLTITNCALGGTLLKSDNPQIGTVTLPLNVSWRGTKFHVASVGIQSDNIRMLVSGDASMEQLKAMQNNLPNWGNSDLHISTYCNLGWFASSFRHTLGLGKFGLRLRHGSMKLRADLTSKGRQSAGGETLTLSDLRGTWKKTPFVINPVLVGAEFQRQGVKWNLLKGIMDQAATADGKPESAPQLNLVVTGQAGGAYALTLQAVLANLVQEAAPFAALNGRTVAGTLDINGTAADIFAQKIPYHLTVALNQLAVGLGQGQPTITEPAVSFHSDGTLLAPHGVIAGADSTFGIQTAEINIPGGNVQITKTAAGWVVPALRADISRVDLPGVMKIAQMFSPALKNDAIGGTIGNSVLAAGYTPGAVNVSQLRLVINKMSFRNTAPNASTAQFIEPKLTLDLACQALTGKATAVNISTLTINTSDGAMDLSIPKPMAIQSGKAMVATIPAFTINANLAKFVPLLEALGKLKTGSKLQGALALNGAVASQGSAITANLDGGVKNYQLTIPGASANLPPDNITLNISGTADPAASTFTCLDNCTIGEHAVTGSGGNLIQLNKGSVVAWSYQSPENVNGSISYNLSRIQALLGPMLPAGLTMAGKYTMKLQITGQLTADKGLRALRKLRIARTALGFDKIAVDGLTLGPGEIPFEESGGILRLVPSAIPANQGTLNTGGHIDFNLPTPEFILTRPLPLVNNIQINGPLGGSLLNFLPLAWGSSDKSGGAIQLSGVINLQLRNADLPLELAQLKKTGTLTGTVSATHITSDSPLFALIGRSMGPFVSNGGSGMALQDSGIRPTAFNLKKGKIYYENLNVLLASFGLDFTGFVGLDQTLNQDVSVSGAGITLPIPLNIDGTTSKPHLHLSAKPLKNLGSDLGNTIKNAPAIINNLKGLFGH